MNRFASKKEAVCLNQPKYDIKVPFYFDRPFFLQPSRQDCRCYVDKVGSVDTFYLLALNSTTDQFLFTADR